MGSEMFVKNQYGKETTRGTAVAATKRFLGTVTIPQDRQPAHPTYSMGRRSRSHRTEIRQILADPIGMSLPEAYFQILPMLFGITLKGGVTAAEATGSQSDYLWDFTPSLTAVAAPDTITLETGDNDQNYEIEYVMGKSIALDFALGENASVSMSCEAFGKQITKSTVTASINPLAVNSIIANTAQLWIDSTWATLGTTVKTGLLRGGSIQIETGNHPKFLAAGVKTMTSHGEGYADLTGSFILEGGAGAVAIFDAYQAGTHLAIRLTFTGPQIGTGTYYTLQYDMFVAIDSVIPLSGFADGNTLYAVQFVAVDDNESTPHNFGVKVTTNANAY
jgi:hypothetical protein